MNLTEPFTVGQKYVAFEWLRNTDFGSDAANLNALIMAREIEELLINVAEEENRNEC